jgi:hypothetical protein
MPVGTPLINPDVSAPKQESIADFNSAYLAARDDDGGRKLQFSIGDYAKLPEPLDTNSASIAVPRGMVVTLYDQPNFGGETLVVKGATDAMMGVARLRDYGWLDRTRSLKVKDLRNFITDGSDPKNPNTQIAEPAMSTVYGSEGYTYNQESSSSSTCSSDVCNCGCWFPWTIVSSVCVVLLCYLMFIRSKRIFAQKILTGQPVPSLLIPAGIVGVLIGLLFGATQMQRLKA